MKKILQAILGLLILPSIVFANVGNSLIKEKTVNGKDSQVLFVMLSKEASVQSTDKADTFKLTLKDVNSKVIYFSNRPERISGQLLTNRFVGQWKNGSFSDMAPNAMIEAVKVNSHHKLQKTESSYAVTLYNPVYSNNHKNLSFDVKMIPGSTSIAKMGTSDYVALFIDSICTSCIGG